MSHPECQSSSSCLGLLDLSTSSRLIGVAQVIYGTVSLVTESDSPSSHLSLCIIMSDILGITAALLIFIGNILLVRENFRPSL